MSVAAGPAATPVRSRIASPLQRAACIWLAGAASVALAAVVALCIGSAEIAPSEVLRLLAFPDGSTSSQVLHELRLPRALAALGTGGLLAVAGLLMQNLLRNPLADPYVLGLSSGAAVGALGAMLAGAGAMLVDAGAAGGALATVALVFVVGRRALAGGADALEASPRLLLTGVILASGWAAIVTVILIVAPEAKLRGMLFWLMGDLAGADRAWPALAGLALLVAAVLPAARDLNAMLRGHDLAFAMGVDVARTRRRMLLAASLATALAVTTAGAIGFVGLIVPHALRLAFGNDQRVLLPASAMAGGAFLLLADTVARSAFAPQQVPVGVVTALLGVPLFIALLMRGPR